MKLAFCQYTPPADVAKNLPPIIMLHGMMDSKLTWNGLAPRIAGLTGREVYTVDARNHGDSGWSDDFSFDILAEDLDEFMEEHGLPKAALVGHSMGGKTALTLALRKPEKVDKLVVEDMTPRNFSTNAGGIVLVLLRALREAITTVPKGVDEATAVKHIGKFILDLVPQEQRPRTSARDYRSQVLPIKRKPDGTYAWKTNLDALEKFLTEKGRLTQQLSGTYPGESLFLYGTKSFFRIYRDEPLIRQYFPRTQIVSVEGANHLIHHEYPNEFLKEVVNFINGYPTIRQVARSKY